VKLADHRKALARLCGHRLIMAQCIPSIARVPERPRQPCAVDAFASTGVGFL
jgi:hypothetical protein